MSRLFEINNISKEYGIDNSKIIALKNASFNIEKKEIISIVGPSGSGKTTLLNLLSGLERTTVGEVLFKDSKYSEMNNKHMTKIRLNEFGFVFQNYCLISSMSVKDNIFLPSIIKNGKVNEELFDDLISRLGLSNRLEHMPCQLSGGEKQRATIARALLTSPSVIFADEPTGNLDSKNSDAVFELLFDLVRKYEQTLIYVTHDMQKAAMASRKMVIWDGEMREE